MRTPSSLRARTQWSQERLASQLGIRQADVSDVEQGKRSVPGKVVAKWAHLINVTGTELAEAIENVQAVHQAVSDAEGWANVAAKSEIGASSEIAGVARHLARFADDPAIPDALRQRAFKVVEKLAPHAVKQSSISMTLASGTTGEFTVADGSSLDPDLDATGLEVGKDGDGLYYIVDSQNGTAFGPIFGDLVQQGGQPLGAKSTDGGRRNLWGQKRYDSENPRDNWGRPKKKRN